jgi:hypothetical protein
MTNKIEIEFGEVSNYEGSKIFSSLATVLGLSVDLVSVFKNRSTNHHIAPTQKKKKNCVPAILHTFGFEWSGEEENFPQTSLEFFWGGKCEKMKRKIFCRHALKTNKMSWMNTSCCSCFFVAVLRFNFIVKVQCFCSMLTV